MAGVLDYRQKCIELLFAGSGNLGTGAAMLFARLCGFWECQFRLHPKQVEERRDEIFRQFLQLCCKNCEPQLYRNFGLAGDLDAQQLACDRGGGGRQQAGKLAAGN